MTRSRKLEDIASNLEDMSVTIEEIKEEADTDAIATEKLDSVRTEMSRAAELIEEALETDGAEVDDQTPPPRSR